MMKISLTNNPFFKFCVIGLRYRLKSDVISHTLFTYNLFCVIGLLYRLKSDVVDN
jgi:hypothetical protein